MLELALALTIHLNTDFDYNEVHPHVRYQHESLIVGGYRNSCNFRQECRSDYSFYVGYKHQRNNAWIELGGVTGYSPAPVIPFVRVGYDFHKNVRGFIGPYVENDYIKERSQVKPLVGIEIFHRF